MARGPARWDLSKSSTVLLLGQVLGACAGSAPGVPAPASAPPPYAADAAAATPAPPAVASTVQPPEDAGAPAPIPQAPATEAACPEGMVLVDGDYCTDLDMQCLKSTYAPQNKKTICWVFAEPTKCIGKKEHKRFCIDTYEYPNKKGERPQVMMNFPEAQRLCASQGKRICTETEWTTACEGPEYKPYPYGYRRDPSICNGDQPYLFPDLKKAFNKDARIAMPERERLYQGKQSGSQPKCVSDYGVYDMPGNADELASSETEKSPYDNVTTGGPWLEGVRNQCRPKIYTHNEGFAYYYLSFRCCAEPDRKSTDPRSPKQIKRREKWKPQP
jgi:formylglycine-generating enzyme